MEDIKVVVPADNDDNNDDDNTWKSCCVHADKRAISFFSQLSISILVIVFCLYQLIHLTTCDDRQAYIGLLTLILGVWLPAPAMRR